MRERKAKQFYLYFLIIVVVAILSLFYSNKIIFLSSLHHLLAFFSLPESLSLKVQPSLFITKIDIVLSCSLFILCAVNYWIRQNIFILVLGIALLCAGIFDSFHYRALELFADGDPDYKYVTASWAISRVYEIILFILSVSFLLSSKAKGVRQNIFSIVWIVAPFVMIGILFYGGASLDYWIDHSYLRDSFVNQPWNLASILLICFTIFVPIREFRETKDTFTMLSLIMACLLQVISNTFMLFVSDAPNDISLNLPYIFKLLSHLVLAFGMSLDVMIISKHEKQALALLAETEGMLAERKGQLEKINADMLQSNRELSNANQRISLIIETAHDAFIALDAMGVVREWNRRAEEIFGWSREDAVGKKLTSISISSEYRAELENDIKLLFSEGVQKPLLNRLIEVTAMHQDGHEFPAELSISVYRYQDSYFFNAFVRDITDRKHAQEELSRRAEELSRSNAELEQFAYVASHDLQEPLRMVSSYTQLLKRRYTNKLDSDADEFIGFAVDGVTRMQGLINDLLEYSRVGTKGKQLLPTKIDQALEKAIQNLKVAIEENQASITYDPMPEVLADEGQLTQLFQNLIGNAIKFRSDKAVEVSIRVTQEDNYWVIKVCDNGIGISQEYFQKIFVIFQRLHARHDYPGTGIGLAICKKIVERHGGRIWVESIQGEGTEFVFTIPIYEAMLIDELENEHFI